ncbi:MAG: ABC transporter substrate binding protein [Bacteroidales bacterium]
MNTNLLRFVRTTLVLAFALTAQGVTAACNTKKVLMVNSYHNTLSWTDSLNLGFIEELQNEYRNTDMYIENLDSKRNSYKNYEQQFSQYLLQKYRNTDNTLIAVTDNDALNYIESIHEKIFPNIPVVFMGVNNRYIFPEMFTGIIEEVNVLKNIELIKKLHPSIKNLYCVVDETTTGIIFDKTLRDSILKIQYPFNIHILNSLTINELLSAISELGEEDVILLLLFNRDKSGLYFSYEEVVDSITKYSKAPVYGTWAFYLNHGIVGGEIISGYEHGRQAAAMALKILGGIPIKDVKPMIGKTKYAFDYRAMSKYRIGILELPKGSFVLNNPYSFLNKYKMEVILSSIILVILIIAIYLLAIVSQHRKRLVKIHQLYNKRLKNKNVQIQESLAKAEEANSLKSTFLANMSHEIRTPMNAIVGFSKLIQMRKGISRDEIDVFLNIIIESSQKLLNLINDIVDISKIEVNQLRFSIKPVNIDSILEDCIRIAKVERARLNKNDVALEFSRPTDSDITVSSDPDRLHQVIMNLLNNALKFTDTGYIRMGYSIQPDWIEIFVRDTGAGIDEQNQAQIFERFWQVDTATTRKYGGSGLGLSICKGIVNGLGGQIGVNSKLGEGATFWLRIPYKIPEPETHSQAKGNAELNAKNWQDKTILIVEDNAASGKLLTEILKHTHANLILSKNAEDAVDICRNNPKVNVILMDICLPGMNGYEATKIIKEFRPALPVIAQTASAMSDEKEKAMLMGCDGYITKPYDIASLLEKLDNLLS